MLKIYSESDATRMVYRDAARIGQHVVGILSALISEISFERKSYDAVSMRHRRRSVCGFQAGCR